jgi:hypothetical protein
MSNYFGLHEVYEVLRKLHVTLIWPKLTALAFWLWQNLYPVRSLMEMARLNAVVPVVIWG